MSLTLTYFVHGTTNDNINGISSGWYDAELSELGVQQSRDLKEQTKDTVFDVIFSSDLQRASESALLTWWGGNIPIFHDPRLRECNYGDFNAQSSAIVEPLQEKYIYERFPHGESYEDVKERVADFVAFLQKEYAGKHVAVVAHKAPQLALDVLLAGKTWEQAFAEDRRHTKSRQPGREYALS